MLILSSLTGADLYLAILAVVSLVAIVALSCVAMLALVLTRRYEVIVYLFATVLRILSTLAGK